MGSDGGMHGEDSAPKGKLNWYCMNGTLDTHTYHDIVADEAAAGCARVVSRRKGGDKASCHTVSVGWSSTGFTRWKVGHER